MKGDVVWLRGGVVAQGLLVLRECKPAVACTEVELAEARADTGAEQPLDDDLLEIALRLPPARVLEDVPHERLAAYQHQAGVQWRGVVRMSHTEGTAYSVGESQSPGVEFRGPRAESRGEIAEALAGGFQPATTLT